jgi:plasmid stabilization system protein ParE
LKRFVFSRFADEDIDELSDYIRSLPTAPGLRLGKELRQTLNSIVSQPKLGLIDSQLSAMFSCRIHRRICLDYLIFYAVEADRVEIIAVLHGKRDVSSIVADRAR